MTKPLGKKLVDQLLAHLNAPTLLKEASAKLEEEKKRRQQFYNDITDAEKVEFINGEIVVHSPVKKEHNDVSHLLSNLIGNYIRKHQLGGYIGVEKVMITLERNDYEPDICFFGKEKAKSFKKGQSLFPAPDFIVEILSKGTKKHDRTIKFQDYQANKVMEYLLIDPIKEVVELYRLDRTNKYELIIKSGEGTLKSKVIKGLSIAIEAIFDEKKNMAELLRILSDK